MRQASGTAPFAHLLPPRRRAGQPLGLKVTSRRAVAARSRSTPVDPACRSPGDARRASFTRTRVAAGDPAARRSLWIGTAYWQTQQAAAAGTHVDSPWYRRTQRATSTFIADITAADAYGRPVSSQAIFDRGAGRHALGAPASSCSTTSCSTTAQRGCPTAAARRRGAISGELRDALIEQRQAAARTCRSCSSPTRSTRSMAASLRATCSLLRAAGVDVVVTDLDALRDSNLSVFQLVAARDQLVGWRAGAGDRLAAATRSTKTTARSRSAPGRGCSTSRPIIAR